MTAGQCVVQGGHWDTSFMFCPAYYSGSCPFGQWYARQLFALTNWSNYGILNDDYGAAIMNPNGYNEIVSVVGGQGWAANYSPYESYTLFGFPNWQLYSCSSQTAALINGNPGIPNTCPGSVTGAAWYIYYGANGGYLNGIHAIAYSGAPSLIFSPPFGNDFITLYRTVG
jgi:hypothetical protein